MISLVDDPTIPDNERLYRRIHPNQVIPEGQGFRPSSIAFRVIQMSVYSASKVSAEAVVSDYPEHSVAYFTAGTARQFDLIVARMRGDRDPAHLLVCPKNKPNNKISKSVAKELVGYSTWEILKPPKS